MAIPNLIQVRKDENCLVVNIEDDTTITTVMNGKIFNIDVLEEGFKVFLEETSSDNLKAEYLLPTIIGDLLHSNQAEVTALSSSDEWFGVTYKEDKDFVKENIQLLVEKGIYPQAL